MLFEALLPMTMAWYLELKLLANPQTEMIYDYSYKILPF